MQSMEERFEELIESYLVGNVNFFLDEIEKLKPLESALLIIMFCERTQDKDRLVRQIQNRLSK